MTTSNMRQSELNYRDATKGAMSAIIQWKRPLLIVFHACVALTYGFAIFTINRPSDATGRPIDPVLDAYGKWRFLTYNNLVLQFVTYSLCLGTHFVPSLTKYRDFFFTTLALPLGMFVVGTFWAVWHIAGREKILPVEANCPDWLNHISHTIMGPINLAQMWLVQHVYLSDSRAIASLLAYLMAYNSYVLFIRFRTGKFVYIFMNDMSAPMVAVFIISMIGATVVLFKVGKFFHEYLHRADTQQLDARQTTVRANYRPGGGSTNGFGTNDELGSNGLTISIIDSY